MKTVIAWALLACSAAAGAGTPCIAPGEPIQWIADYCMLKLETDDEIAASACIERERRTRFANGCASNTHFKKRMCVSLVNSGIRADTVRQCVRDPAFKGRTVEVGGVGR